ncbi:MAG: dienelactone hydrolase family protein [Gammaproteobacteria bacterium]|jgi:carboxymethylenebutenolidase|nr:dienelactone hydrolase family protein [Gammaproteobacteria bacterium]MBT3723093.1 dienelactone hydrolase family protein [Gammaproteobacteria bacterium]MBT4452012.1 dienelactone hydrolase family protein [Gammaproteobacteria bacterium]
MTEPTQIKIPQEAFDWYDEYAHGYIDRRTFMSRLAKLAGVGLSMSVLTGALMPNYALAEQVSFNDSDIHASFETFESPDGHLEGRGYLVKPAKLTGTTAAVLVVHENRGLNPYIKDVARRLAKQGYVAFAPDALHSLGGYPGNDDEGKSMQKSLERARIEQDFVAAAKFLKSHELCNGKLGVVGFCFGGYISNMLAAILPDIINAAVPFYGTPAKDSIVRNIKGPLMLQFAELDKRVNKSWPAYEALLKQMKVDYQAFIYPGVNHGFHNDSTGRYNKEAAELAWSRTLSFFGNHL